MLLGEKIQKIINKTLIGIVTFAALASCKSVVDARIYKNLPESTITDTFPASYQPYIDALKKIYPNAIFKAVNTGLDWNTVLKHESYDVNVGISTVHKDEAPVWKRDGENNFVDGPFVTASKEAVAYVMDPRNSLSEEYIFQFNIQTYNKAMNSLVIDKVLEGTEVVGERKRQYQFKTKDNWIDMGMTYSELIYKVAGEQNVDAVYIASRMRQETSCKISSNGSINGISSAYPGVYNFFNIGATPNEDGLGAITNGLRKASGNGWTTPYKSISGGVGIIRNRYIKYGQYSTYFQKFDVNNPYGNATVLMGCQYQTYIKAPRRESLNSYSAYKKLNMLGTAFQFYIPVYKNMPNQACPEPGTVVKTDQLKIGDFGITGVNPKTKMTELAAKIVSDGLTIKMKNLLGQELAGDSYVGTGTVVELYTDAGEVANSYIVTIYGDVNGDGNISPSDYVKVKNKILSKETLDVKCEKSADLNNDGAISPSDYVKIKNYILKKENIIQ